MTASPPRGRSTVSTWALAAALLRRMALIAAAAAIFGAVGLVALQLVDDAAGPPPSGAQSPLLAPLPPVEIGSRPPSGELVVPVGGEEAR